MLSFGVKELLVNAVPLGWLGLEQQKLDAKSGNRGKDAREREKDTGREEENECEYRCSRFRDATSCSFFLSESKVHQKCIKKLCH